MSAKTNSRTILDTIADRIVTDLPEQKRRVPLAALERRTGELPPAIPFAAALLGDGTTTQVIAEIKRASPSKGVIAEQVDPPAIAHDYRRAGAAAISVLTNAPFFQGSLDDLAAVAAIAHELAPETSPLPGLGAAQPTGRGVMDPIPVLRKDFLVDPYQVVEARAAGADAVLLIVALLPGSRLSEMLSVVHDYGLEALVEIHDESEAAAAVESGARVIGINNRDLHTFQVDLATTERLAGLIPPDRVLVAESGIHARADVARLAAAGARAVLVGESLMLAADKQAALGALLQ